MTRAAGLHRMAKVWRALPERDREVFGAVRFEGLDYLTAAARCGCSVDEIEQTLTRVLLALDRGDAG